MIWSRVKHNWGDQSMINLTFPDNEIMIMGLIWRSTATFTYENTFASAINIISSKGRRTQLRQKTLKPGESLQWRDNELNGVSYHQPHDCLLKRLFRRRSKKTSKLRVTGLCAGNSPVISRKKGQSRGKCFHLMTSSCEASINGS